MYRNTYKIDFSRIEIPEYNEKKGEITKNIGGNASSEITGRRTRSLEQAIQDYNDSVNAAARNTDGSLSSRPADKLKGNVFEAHQKGSYNIEAAAQGKADQTKASMGGDTKSDGTPISKTNETTDIVIETKDNPWSKTREKPYQAKSGDTAEKELQNPKYNEVGKVGPEDQVGTDKAQIKDKVGSKDIKSDPINSDELDSLTSDAQNQTAEYSSEKAKQKKRQLNRLNLIDAAKTGALVGGISSAIGEIIDILKNGKELTQEQFIASVKNVLGGATDGAIRGTAIVFATQLFDVSANSLGAIPVMAGANVVVDLAKDLFRFANGKLDADELLTNTVTNSMQSLGSFTGSYLGGQAATALISAVTGADMAAVGAGIGVPFGPLGIVIGSVVGGVIIGGAVNLVIKDSKKDGYEKFQIALDNAKRGVALDPSRQVFVFANAMSRLEEQQFSFKSLIPGHNFISDMTEYNLKKKAMQNMHHQMDRHIDKAKKYAYQRMIDLYESQCKDIENQFLNQQKLMQQNFSNDIGAYIGESYSTYIKNYNMIGNAIAQNVKDLEKRNNEQNEILRADDNRIEANRQINRILSEFMSNVEKSTPGGSVQDMDLKPIMGQLLDFIKADKMLCDKQYISMDDALELFEAG
jgi:hypothetical protein